jgi:antitoxin (DNA-binding transcriptional repressor) of toxin-antitoxin stability system
MKSAKIGELRNELSRFLAYVRRGGVVRVFDRDRPIADIMPVREAASTGSVALDQTLAELERRGGLRRGTGVVPERLLRGRLPKAKRSVLEALLDERATSASEEIE